MWCRRRADKMNGGILHTDLYGDLLKVYPKSPSSEYASFSDLWQLVCLGVSIVTKNYYEWATKKMNVQLPKWILYAKWQHPNGIRSLNQSASGILIGIASHKLSPERMNKYNLGFGIPHSPLAVTHLISGMKDFRTGDPTVVVSLNSENKQYLSCPIDAVYGEMRGHPQAPRHPLPHRGKDLHSLWEWLYPQGESGYCH